jgi:hypothetical protein
MKKTRKKLVLHRETLWGLVHVQGGTYTQGTMGQSAQVSNCYAETEDCSGHVHPMCASPSDLTAC